MHYSNRIEDYQAAAANVEGFAFYNKDYNGAEYVVGNYTSVMTKFPSLNVGTEQERKDAALLRNMRGIIFDKNGEVIRLPFQKFMNLNQDEDNRFENLDWSSFEVFDKLDGSLCAPFKLNNHIVWGSKAGLTHMTPMFAAFVNDHPNYQRFAEEVIDGCITPIFEFTTPENRIVIDYGSEPQMTLLAARDMLTGEYVDLTNYADWYGISMVKRWEVDNNDPNGFCESIRDLKGSEGVVVAFPNGYRVKLKADEYCSLHKTRECIERERFVVEQILEERIDDMLPLVPDHNREPLREFAESVVKLVEKVTEDALVNLKKASNIYVTRKDFAQSSFLTAAEKQIGFKLMGNIQDLSEWDFTTSEIEKLVKERIIKSCQSSETNYNEHVRRDLFQGQLPKWNIWFTLESQES